MITRKVVLVAVVQAIVLTVLANALPTWQDEEFTLATTAHGVAYAFHRALDYELQAPLYFVLLAALRTLGPSVLLAREFSVLTQVATTFACAAIARRIWPQRDPWIFCALVASNPFGIYAALDIRTYALSLLESACLFAAFLEGFFYGSDVRARVALVVCAILGLYTQYFIAFEMIALFFALCLTGRVAAVRDYVLCCLVAAVTFVPLGLYVRGQASGTLSVEKSTPQGFGGMLLHPVNLLLSRDYLVETARWQKFAYVAMRLAFVALTIAGRPRFDRKLQALTVVLVVVDSIYVVLADVFKLNLLIPRHFVALFIPEVAFVYALVSSYTGAHARRFALATAAIFALANGLQFFDIYKTGAKEGDARRVGTYLAANAKPGDAIAVYPGDAVAPIARYYGGGLAIEGFPIPQNPVTYDVDAALVRSPAEAAAAFDRLPASAHLWFVTVLVCNGNIHGCRTTLDVMQRRYTVLRHASFFEADVYELARSSR